MAEQRIEVEFAAPVPDAAIHELAEAGVTIETSTLTVDAPTRNAAVDTVKHALRSTGVSPTFPEPARDRGGLVDTIRRGAASLAGAVALIYVAGGAILALRLEAADLPSAAVIGQLPRDFLFSIGIGNAVIPALIVALLYSVYRGSEGKTYTWQRIRPFHQRSYSEKAQEPRKALRTGELDGSGKKLKVDESGKPVTVTRRRDTRPWHLATAGAGAMALVAPSLVNVVRVQDAGNTGFYVAFFVGAFLLAFIAMIAYLHIRTRLAKRHSANYRSATAVIEHSLLVGGVAVIGAAAFWASWPLTPAAVCRNSATRGPYVGVLVGETKERVYVGANRQIRSFPLGDVSVVRIGEQHAHQPCPAPGG